MLANLRKTHKLTKLLMGKFSIEVQKFEGFQAL